MSSATGVAAVDLKRFSLLSEFSEEDREILGEELESLEVEAGESVRISSRRGAIRARAIVTAAVGRGRIFVPMHFQATNELTLPSFDPYSRQPSYKHCAVKIERTRESRTS